MSKIIEKLKSNAAKYVAIGALAAFAYGIPDANATEQKREPTKVASINKDFSKKASKQEPKTTIEYAINSHKVSKENIGKIFVGKDNVVAFKVGKDLVENINGCYINGVKIYAERENDVFFCDYNNHESGEDFVSDINNVKAYVFSAKKDKMRTKIVASARIGKGFDVAYVDVKPSTTLARVSPRENTTTIDNLVAREIPTTVAAPIITSRNDDYKPSTQTTRIKDAAKPNYKLSGDAETPKIGFDIGRVKPQGTFLIARQDGTIGRAREIMIGPAPRATDIRNQEYNSAPQIIIKETESAKPSETYNIVPPKPSVAYVITPENRRLQVDPNLIKPRAELPAATAPKTEVVRGTVFDNVPLNVEIIKSEDGKVTTTIVQPEQPSLEQRVAQADTSSEPSIVQRTTDYISNIGTSVKDALSSVNYDSLKGFKIGVGDVNFSGLSNKKVFSLGYEFDLPRKLYFVDKVSPSIHFLFGSNSTNYNTSKNIDITNVPRLGTFTTDVKGEYKDRSTSGFGGSVLFGNETFKIGPQVFLLRGNVSGSATNIENFYNTAGVLSKTKVDQLNSIDSSRKGIALGLSGEYSISDNLSFSASIGKWRLSPGSVNDAIPKGSSDITLPSRGNYFGIGMNYKF